jgi:SAM-dependent methyltransferase
MPTVVASAAAWFESWFDSPHYHLLYGHRDEREAAALVDALVARLRPADGAKALDLGCGAGRHSRQLAARGLDVTGLDLSANSIRQARRFEAPHLRFRRHDMRRPFGHERYDLLFNLFTSFGYFDSAADHLGVVANMARALRPGGRLLLDYLNARQAESALVPEEVRLVNGVAYRVTRWTDATHFYKRIRIEPGSADGSLEHLERVAKFNLDDFRRMFQRYGLRLETVYGNYELDAYDPSSSPRLILLARKAASPAQAPGLRPEGSPDLMPQGSPGLRPQTPSLLTVWHGRGSASQA